jgi:UDP-2,3-diacylglucosamine pyrophosphatase LpxH
MSTNEPNNEPTPNLLIISDLHLSEGFAIHDGKFSQLEDFFSDQPFADFLKHHQDNCEQGQPWRLIIAGDLFDFLQVIAKPALTPRELDDKINHWENDSLIAYATVAEQHKQSRLDTLGQWIGQIRQGLQKKSDRQVEFQALTESLNRLDRKRGEGLCGGGVWLLEQLVLESWILVNTEELKLSKRTIEYGLGTSWQETVWKLDRIAEGHPIFFRALGKFMEKDNELFILSGNHDIELHWPGVQERLCQLLGDAAGTAPVKITFLPWIYHEPGLLYLEHGQQYESANAFDNILQPTLPENPHFIKFPPGSMLVRYLFNKIEEAYPFADNIRPITRFFSWAFEHDMLTLITIIFRYADGFTKFASTLIWRSGFKPLIYRNKPIALEHSLAKSKRLNPEADLQDDFLLAVDTAARHIRRGKIKRGRTLLLLLLVPVLILIPVAFIFGPAIYLLTTSTDSFVVKLALSVVSTIFGILFKQVLAPLVLREVAGEDYLIEAAEQVKETLADHNLPSVDYIIFGHNHHPDIIRVGAKKDSWYVNTGSWLYSQGIVQDWLQQTNYHSFLKIVRDGTTVSPELRFWNAMTKSVEYIRLRPPLKPHKRRKKPRRERK